MQNIAKYVFVSAVFGLAFNSCKEPEMRDAVIQNQADKIEIVDFEGEKVVVPSDFPKELFSQSQDDFDKYYSRISADSKSRKAATMGGITYDELLPILVKHLSKYPQINSEDEISSDDLTRIFKDFPDIRTKAQADDRRMVIFDYYQTLAKRDIIAEVVKLENALGKNGRTTDVSPSTLSTPEKNHLLLNPGYAQWYVQAANDAYAFVMLVYQNNDEDTKSNAFKHATCNALSIRYILKGSPSSENQAIDFTQDGTSKHEQDNNGNQSYSDQSAMDLHNNMSARVWMEGETKWGIGPFRKMPNVDDIVNTMASKANSGPLLLTKAAILNLHGGDNATTWNNLYNNLYGPYQHLIHLK